MSADENGRYYQSDDGLRLFYREFGAGRGGTPVICLPGLTRNSRDFEDLADRLADRRRIITPDLRGRGYSDYDPVWQNYHPGTYIRDVVRLLDTLDIDKVIVIGTSLGGLIAMGMAAACGHRLAGVVMNDIGPEIHPAGIQRVSQYTGRMPPVDSWDAAIAQTREVYGEWLPGLSDDDWRGMARKAYREIEGPVPRLDMDPMIGEAVRNVGPQTGDPWQYFDALADLPVTLLWGRNSDILTADIIERMTARKRDLEVVPVANRGHVPLLDEPECVAAIDAFLARVP